MARCLIAGQHASRDLEERLLLPRVKVLVTPCFRVLRAPTDENDIPPCCACVHCEGFCSCDSNTGPDNPNNIETDDEGSYAEHLERRRAWVNYLSKRDE